MTRRKEPPAKGTIGRVLYDARTDLGLSQRELATRLGTSRRRYMDWENNVHRPAAHYSEGLAEVLNVPVEKILDPAVAHIRRNQEPRVRKLLTETARLRQELKDCRRENSELRQQVARLAS